MNYLFTSESVSEGHPDKVSDQISDAILDEFLARDAHSKVACETLVTTGQVIIAGEVKSQAYIDLQSVARRVISDIGYTRPSWASMPARAACYRLCMSRAVTSTAAWSVSTPRSKAPATKA